MKQLLVCLILSVALTVSAPQGQKKGQKGDLRKGKPKSERVDERSFNCSDYQDDGFECVAHDLCRDGEIIVDGGKS